jgi:MoaA/NifB/PqqE/SkfB family radical SAM enzyme
MDSVLRRVVREIRLSGVRRTALHAKRTLVARMSGLPGMLTVEASSWCNLRCAFCATREHRMEERRGKPFLSLGEFRALADEVRSFCSQVNFSLFGEPLANPDLPRMIACAEERGMSTTLFTNATLLTRHKARELAVSGLTRVVASLESFDRDLYESTKCGADLGRTLDNIRGLIQVRDAPGPRKPQIVLRVVLTRKTGQEMDLFIRKAREMRVDGVSFKPLTVWPQGTEAFRKAMMEGFAVDHRVSRYTGDRHGRLVLRGRETPCPSLNTPAVLSDGSVCLCWYDMLGETVAGNLNDEPFLSIWERSRSFRHGVMAGGGAYSLCRECPGTGMERDLTLWFRA